MSDQSALRRETRYGMPAADHVLFNRHYVLGYSYYFRQAKWALEIVNPLGVDDDGEEEEAQDAGQGDGGMERGRPHRRGRGTRGRRRR